MILADTSVWIDHLRCPDADLNRLLGMDSVLGHPFVTGEVAMGNLPKRKWVLGILLRLGQMPVSREHEVLQFCGIAWPFRHRSKLHRCPSAGGDKNGARSASLDARQAPACRQLALWCRRTSLALAPRGAPPRPRHRHAQT